MSAISWRTVLHDAFLIVAGSLIFAVGVDMFEIPNGLAAGGVTGLATVFYAIADNLGFYLPVGLQTIAMNVLRSRLYEMELARRAEELDELRGPKRDIGFGNQIRSYVLYPYQLVKDLRTGVETSNVDSVLKDGDLDRFVVGYHRWSVGEEQAL